MFVYWSVSMQLWSKLAWFSLWQEGVVTVAGDERHPFQDNDLVTFRELVGLEELNGCQKKIKGYFHRWVKWFFSANMPNVLSYIDLSINQFSIGDISTIEGTYQRGGIAREVKQHIELSFVRFRRFSSANYKILI